VKLALAVWNGRISPVFDTSRQLLVLEVEGGEALSRREHEIAAEEAFAKVARLAELGVEVLICGAVSRPLAEMIAIRGIRLVPFVAGDAEEVLAAFLAGNLPSSGMTMPGCCGRRLRFRGGMGGRACRGGRRVW
jgi:predicted Fe-Mo cluster-binding NifX family protein